MTLRLFYSVVAFLWVLNLFDAILTAIAVSQAKAIEINPIPAYLLEQGIGWFLLVKIGAATLALGALLIRIRQTPKAIASWALPPLIVACLVLLSGVGLSTWALIG